MTNKKPAKGANEKKPVHAVPPISPPERPLESGGRGGPDPTRYGDWEIAGKCVDF